MNCVQCGKEILDALRVTKRYCSDKCRISHHYLKDVSPREIVVNDNHDCMTKEEMLNLLNTCLEEDKDFINTKEGCLNLFVLNFGFEFELDPISGKYILVERK